MALTSFSCLFCAHDWGASRWRSRTTSDEATCYYYQPAMVAQLAWYYSWRLLCAVRTSEHISSVFTGPLETQRRKEGPLPFVSCRQDWKFWIQRATFVLWLTSTVCFVITLVKQSHLFLLDENLVVFKLNFLWLLVRAFYCLIHSWNYLNLFQLLILAHLKFTGAKLHRVGIHNCSIPYAMSFNISKRKGMTRVERVRNSLWLIWEL